MKKKLLAALLATAMTVTMFAGCGTPGSKDSKKDDSSASSGKKRITYTPVSYTHLTLPTNSRV